MKFFSSNYICFVKLGSIFNTLRSAIKKILERDDISTSKLVLCISRILSSEQTPVSNEIIGKDVAKTDASSKVSIVSANIFLLGISLLVISMT